MLVVEKATPWPTFSCASGVSRLRRETEPVRPRLAGAVCHREAAVAGRGVVQGQAVAGGIEAQRQPAVVGLAVAVLRVGDLADEVAHDLGIREGDVQHRAVGERDLQVGRE